jgi:hypothetical protein
VALHAASADAAEQQAVQGVVVPGPVRLMVTLRPAASDQEFPGAVEGTGVDDRGVGDLVGVDPAALIVPPHLARVTQGDVMHVDQDLVLALPVPDLPTGVAGLVMIARMAYLLHATPQRWPLRAGSCADGQATPSAVSRSAMA